MRHNLAVALYDLGDARGALGLLADARREVDLVGLPRQQEWVLMSSVAAASFLLRGDEGQAPVDGEEREELLPGLVSEWTAQAVLLGTGPSSSAKGWPTGVARRGARPARPSCGATSTARSATPGTRSAWSGASASSTSWPGRGRCSRRSSWTSTGWTRPRTSSSRPPPATDRLGSVTSVMVWHMLAMCRERRGDLEGALAAMRRYVTAVTASRDMQVHSTAAVNAARLRREEVERERDSWRRTSEHERRQARVDPLTGIENRRAFTDAMTDHARVASRLALAIVDLDHFKDVNDRFGHVVGDEVLVRVGVAMTAAVAGSEVGPGAGLYPVGAEEFVLAFAVDGLEEPAVVGAVERVRTAVAGVDFSDIPLPVREDSPGRLEVTASAGMVVGVPVEAQRPRPATCCGSPTGTCTRPRTPAATASSVPSGAGPWGRRSLATSVPGGRRSRGRLSERRAPAGLRQSA